MDEQFKTLQDAIFGGDIDSGVERALALVDAGVAPLAIFTDCIEPTLQEVGDKFSKLEIFLPEMINSADVVKAIQGALESHLGADGEQTSKGRIVIGTVAGDLHDIGKNIVRSMLEVNGFEVKDLGVDVDPSTIVSAAKEFEADIVAMSALMLPSLPYARDTIEMIRAAGLHDQVKVMIGGGPVTEDWTLEAGADAYGDDAVEAVAVAYQLMAA
jgi:methylmalonyl-CoA mutase cobalamin-binding domain/chain